MTHDQSDMRSFLADADKAGVALHINKPVDVASEVAALCSETFRPTVFHNLKGFDGFRLVDGLTRTRETQALALGLDCPPNQVIPSYAARLAEGPGTVVQVKASPAQDVVWENDDVKLSRLPIPVESEGMDLPHVNPHLTANMENFESTSTWVLKRRKFQKSSLQPRNSNFARNCVTHSRCSPDG